MTTARDISYEVEGTTMIGRMYLPDGDGKRPGILMAHEGGGLDDFQRGHAAHLAELGYVAFALDYYGGGKPLSDPQDMMARIGSLMGDPLHTRSLAKAGLDILLAEPRTDASRIGATGYCFGGTMVLELARSGADVHAVVGFHSGLGTARAEDAKNIKAKILVCIGTEDPFVPPEQRAAFESEMRAGKVDWRMNLYGGIEHSFTRPGAEDMGMAGLRYDKATDERSWRAMRDLFDETFN